MMLVIKPQQRSTWWHWSVLTLVGLSVTYSWLWVFTHRPIHQPEIEMSSEVDRDALPLSIVLEAPLANIEQQTIVEEPEHASAPSAESVSMAESPPPQVEAIEPVAVVAVTPPVAPKVQAPAPVAVRDRGAPPLQNRNPIVAAVFKSTTPNVARPNSSPPPAGNKTSTIPTVKARPSSQADNTNPMSTAPTENSVAANTVQPARSAVSGVEPVPVSRLTRMPTFVHKELPTDPEDVQIPLGGVRVIARITLDETAAVRDVQIDKSGASPFDVAVISAIHRSRFTPGYVGDQPVAAVFNQTYRFQLQ